jgi:hypothetical protein
MILAVYYQPAIKQMKNKRIKPKNARLSGKKIV